MSLGEGFAVVLSGLGALFFCAGTAGLLRFPDTMSRLHAITKVDNLGLGLTVAALVARAESWFAMGELAFIWLVAATAGATSGSLLADAVAREDQGP